MNQVQFVITGSFAALEPRVYPGVSIYFKEDLDACPRCGGKLCKHGYTKSDFHAVFTDHKISTSRQVCKDCQWRSIPSIKSLFGINIHPDLGRMQSEFGGTLFL